MIYKSSKEMYFFCIEVIMKTFACFNSNTIFVLERIKDDETEARFVIKKMR